MVFSVVSERQSPVATLVYQQANVDGDVNVLNAMPAGFGDCLVEDVMVLVNGIATVVADPFNLGVRAVAWDGINIVDHGGTARWVQVSATSVTARVWPEQPFLLRSGDSLIVSYSEVDTNASPTGDLTITVKARRLRDPVISPTSEPEIVFTS